MPQNTGNNFNSDVAKMWVFLPTTHMLPPYIKRKRCKKNSTSYRTRRKEKRDAAKEEKRKKRKEEKEEGRPRCRAAGHRDPPLGLAGPTRPTVFFFFVFGDLRNDLAGRMKPTAGSSRKDLARDQTPRGQPTFAADPPRSRPTSHRDPRLGLAGRGSGFLFLFFLPV
jgi:hypothetical protein